jgi:acetyl-CoA C-acetyltransferase
MGEHAELMARRWGVSRDAQDELALHSHQQLAKAYDDGFFTDLMTPFNGLRQDNNLRVELSAEQLAALKPVFDRKVCPGSGTLSAGNSTPLTDGASVVLLASEAWAAARGLPVLAWITQCEVAAVDFVGRAPAGALDPQADESEGAEGLLMAPAYAVPRMLARAGLSLQDFDFYEIHEAFAAQVLCTLKAWEDPRFCRERLGLEQPLGAIDRARLNVRGGSLATGHPFAATGGRIVAALAKMLAQNGSGRGLISVCAAGGQGVVAILER